MKIYTKTGDTGTTGLSGGDRTSKHSLRIQAIGDVDELNAHLGLCRVHGADTIFELRIAHIQSRLFDVGAELSCPPDGKFQFATLDESEIRMLEESIDVQTAELEPLKQFILPGGSPLAAHFHIARTVCRRAERSLVALNDVEPVRAVVLTYVNRLSDWLFTAARTANLVSGVEDIKWSSNHD